jgi:hypothetical protein
VTYAQFGESACREILTSLLIQSAPRNNPVIDLLIKYLFQLKYWKLICKKKEIYSL